MPISSQFSLTLELTRLIPLSLIGDATQRAVLGLARQLKNSGSDIIIEQDLAQLFGRSRIDTLMESKFRSLVAGGTTTILTDEIRLASGQGPTVTRAFQERPYFSTLVQLSLLTWVYDTSALAQGLVDVLEAKYNHAPTEYLSPPDQNGVLGTLKVCEEETSLFDWNNLLRAVWAVLHGQSPYRQSSSLNKTLLHGLLDMFPLVQTLPLDRMIHVRCFTDITAMVVWAHHILGLTVLVKYDGREARFGKGCEQVYLESSKDISIALYDSSGSSNEMLYFTQGNIYDVGISSTFKQQLLGYGKSNLSKICIVYRSSAALIQDIAAVTVAITLLVHSALDSGNGRFIHSQPDRKAQKRILEASQIFFGMEVSETAVMVYMNHYRTQPLESTLPPPASIMSIAPDELVESKEDIWHELLIEAKALASILLAVSYVDDIGSCATLPLGSRYGLRKHPLVDRIHCWDGSAPIVIEEGSIFEILALLLAGQVPTEQLERLALVSSHGWSVYLTSFNNDDPASLPVERVKVARGTPYRGDVRINSIIDGPDSESGVTRARKVTDSGKPLASRNLLLVRRWKTMFSLQGNYTATLLVFETKYEAPEKYNYFRAGYRVLHSSLWSAKPTQACVHGTNTAFTLPLGCAAFVGYPREHETENDLKATRIAISLTEDSPDARWRSLIAGFERNAPRANMLCANNCCVSCAVSQAAAVPGLWNVIL